MCCARLLAEILVSIFMHFIFFFVTLNYSGGLLLCSHLRSGAPSKKINNTSFVGCQHECVRRTIKNCLGIFKRHCVFQLLRNSIVIYIIKNKNKKILLHERHFSLKLFHLSSVSTSKVIQFCPAILSNNKLSNADTHKNWLIRNITKYNISHNRSFSVDTLTNFTFVKQNGFYFSSHPNRHKMIFFGISLKWQIQSWSYFDEWSDDLLIVPVYLKPPRKIAASTPIFTCKVLSTRKSRTWIKQRPSRAVYKRNQWTSKWHRNNTSNQLTLSNEKWTWVFDIFLTSFFSYEQNFLV